SRRREAAPSAGRDTAVTHEQTIADQAEDLDGRQTGRRTGSAGSRRRDSPAVGAGPLAATACRGGETLDDRGGDHPRRGIPRPERYQTSLVAAGRCDGLSGGGQSRENAGRRRRSGAAGTVPERARVAADR